MLHCTELHCIEPGKTLCLGIMEFCVMNSHSFRDVMYLLPLRNGLQNLRNIFKIRLIFKSRQKGIEMMASKVLKMPIDSIPLVSLHVGDFHTFERTSKLVFMDCVVRSTVNLLVMLS